MDNLSRFRAAQKRLDMKEGLQKPLVTSLSPGARVHDAVRDAEMLPSMLLGSL
jgi:hypothetical protein